jgi:excisionase family DNA binding protein
MCVQMAARTRTRTLEPKAVRIQEFAELMSMSRRSVYNMIEAGELRTVMIRGMRLVPMTEADRLLGADEDRSGRHHVKSSA